MCRCAPCIPAMPPAQSCHAPLCPESCPFGAKRRRRGCGTEGSSVLQRFRCLLCLSTIPRQGHPRQTQPCTSQTLPLCIHKLALYTLKNEEAPVKMQVFIYKALKVNEDFTIKVQQIGFQCLKKQINQGLKRGLF